jgi:leucyl aminopeptidase
MSKIIPQSNPDVVVVSLVATTDNSPSILESLKFKAKFGQIAILVESKQIFVGINNELKVKTLDPFSAPDYFNLGAKVANRLKATTFRKLSITPPSSVSSKQFEDFLLGLMQASHEFDRYVKEAKSIDLEIFVPDSKTNKENKPEVIAMVPQNQTILPIVSNSSFANLEAINQGITITRDLVNETPQMVNPSTMLGLIQAQFENNSQVRIQSFDYEQMEQMEMGGIVAVGKASIHKPIMVHTTIKPKREAKKKIVLVGKGITYDCGGLDIKTGGHMKDMKMDMAGSATMFGVTKALAAIGLDNVELHWISAFAENMVDGTAYKADDILTTYSGQTVEVYNTDAEGRLTLADALSYATFLNPDYIVDAATLTGACVRAVSENFTAFMTNSEYLKNTLLAKFESENEPTIYTPMPERLRANVVGNISDLVNTAVKAVAEAGHITAGLFLSHFIDQNCFRNDKLVMTEPKCYDWVHLDIAGSAYNNKNNSLETNGATGQSVRTLVNWILDEDK